MAIHLGDHDDPDQPVVARGQHHPRARHPTPTGLRRGQARVRDIERHQPWWHRPLGIPRTLTHSARRDRPDRLLWLADILRRIYSLACCTAIAGNPTASHPASADAPSRTTTGSLLSPRRHPRGGLRQFVVNRQQREIPLPVIPRTLHRHPADSLLPRQHHPRQDPSPDVRERVRDDMARRQHPLRPRRLPRARMPRRSPHLRQPTSPQRRHAAPQPRRPAVPSLPRLGLIAVDVQRQERPRSRHTDPASASAPGFVSFRPMPSRCHRPQAHTSAVCRRPLAHDSPRPASSPSTSRRESGPAYPGRPPTPLRAPPRNTSKAEDSPTKSSPYSFKHSLSGPGTLLGIPELDGLPGRADMTGGQWYPIPGDVSGRRPPVRPTRAPVVAPSRRQAIDRQRPPSVPASDNGMLFIAHSHGRARDFVGHARRRDRPSPPRSPPGVFLGQGECDPHCRCDAQAAAAGRCASESHCRSGRG